MGVPESNPFTPSLVTARVVLTPLTLEDAPGLFAYRSDPEVSRFQFFEPRSLDDARDFIATAEESGWGQLGIRIEGGSVLAGHVAFRLCGDPPAQAEMGVSLARQHQGHGYATEAIGAVLEYLFAELGVHRAFASIDPRNTASLALFARLGMRQEAHHRESTWFKGEWADDVVVALLKTEWQARARAVESTDVVVRRYRASDRAAVLELVRRFSEFELPAWRSHEQIDAANYEAISRSLDAMAEREEFFVAEKSGSFAGFVHLQTKVDHFTGERVGYVADLAVHPDSERAGVATLLLDQAVAWARDQGFRLIALDVFDGNDRAKRLYEKQGFGRDTVQYTRPVDRWHPRPRS